MDRRGSLIITPRGAAEELFGLGAIQVAGETAHGTMRTAAWMRDGWGRPVAGMLGVLLDDVVGQATLTARPEGCWPVTTELSIDVLAVLPTDGTVLTARSELLAADDRVGVGRGDVRDPAGRRLATATVTTQYVTGVPALPARERADPPTAIHGVREVFDGVLEVEPGARATLDVPPGRALENVAGRGHGGVLAALVDLVATEVVADDERPPRTAGLRVTYLRPASLDGPLRFVAEVVRRGRATSFVRVDVTGGDGRLCASASVTGGPSPTVSTHFG